MPLSAGMQNRTPGSSAQDANVLVMPGRFISTEEADMILTEFFSTKFDGGRHQNRIDKIPVK